MDIILPPKKNVIMDSQIMSSLMACERLTDLQFNMHLQPITGKGNSLEAGSVVHEILKVFYHEFKEHARRALAIDVAMEAGKKYYLTVTKNIPLEDICHPNGHLDKIGYETIERTMKDYFLYYSNEYWTPLEIEKVLGKITYEDDEIRVLWKAKLDLKTDTNQGIYPVDHKTFKQTRQTLDLNNQFMGQCVVNESNSMIINKIGWQKSLKPDKKFLRTMMSYSTDRLKEWQELTGYFGKYLIGLNESGYYPPRFTHCDKFNGCIYRGVCSSDRNMREEELKLHFVVGEPWNPEDE